MHQAVYLAQKPLIMHCKLVASSEWKMIAVSSAYKYNSIFLQLSWNTSLPNNIKINGESNEP